MEQMNEKTASELKEVLEILQLSIERYENGDHERWDTLLREAAEIIQHVLQE